MALPSSHIDLEKEQRLVELSKKDIRHFQPLYQKYYDQVYRYIYRRTDDDALAADLCSQTFLKALSNIRKFTWQGKPLVAWLYTIAGNEVKKHFRNRREIFVIEEDRIEEVAEFKDEWKQLTQDKMIVILNELEEDELRLIELKYFEDNTFAEMALLLDMKESAVKMKVYRLLKKLKLRIEENHEPIRHKNT